MLACTRLVFLTGAVGVAVSVGSSAVAVEPPPASSGPACTESSPGYDAREVVCRFSKAHSGGRFEFRASFSGGHDDTSARLEPFIDDSPLVCDEGSKTRLFAEDGDVSLWCTFPVGDLAQKERVLKVVIRWSHAEYVGFGLAAK